MPRTLSEARKVAGSAKYKQSNTTWNYIVLQGQFVYSVYSVVKPREFIHFVCLGV